MKVLSLFDGMSCGQLALNYAGVKYSKYYASEVDKHAITVTQANFPETVQMGDVTNWREWSVNWSEIDLILAGSPCQGFSFAGNGKGFNDHRSKLFFTFLQILNHVKKVNPGVKFLLENVKMKKEFLNFISVCTGVVPVMINSALVSAQNRQRFYWANWSFGQPVDRGLTLADIIENDDFPDREKSFAIDASYHKGGDLNQYFKKSRRQVVFKVNDNHRVSAVNETKTGFRPYRNDARKSGIGELGVIARLTGKTCTSLASRPPNVAVNDDLSNLFYRKLTPVECERLQTVPDDYTNHVSDTQRYKMLGNGWTVEVIAHILRGLRTCQ